MKRLCILVLTLSLFAIACGSDDVSVSVAAEQPTTPASEEPATDDAPLGGGPYPIGTIEVVVTDSNTDVQTASYSLTCLGDSATLTGDWAPAIQDGVLGSADDLMCRALGDPGVQSRMVFRCGYRGLCSCVRMSLAGQKSQLCSLISQWQS